MSMPPASAIMSSYSSPAWVMPGPVVGLGLKGVFQAVLDLKTVRKIDPEARRVPGLGRLNRYRCGERQGLFFLDVLHFGNESRVHSAKFFSRPVGWLQVGAVVGLFPGFRR